MRKINEVKNKDFYTACILRALGFPFERIEKGTDRFSLFVFFDPRGEAEEIIGKYWRRELPIEAKDLVDAIHDMKSILYSK